MSARSELRRLPAPGPLTLLLGLLTGVGPLTIDAYLPALPALRTDLGTTTALAQATMTGTLLGLPVVQLVVGPLSDAVGRRRPVLVGLAVHVVVCAGAGLATTIDVLVGLRVLQGAGAAAAAVVTLAVVHDCFAGREAARGISRLMLVMGTAPVLAPVLGSAVLTVADWRAVFFVLAAVSAVLFATVFLVLPETNPSTRIGSVRSGSSRRVSVREIFRRAPADVVALGRDRVYVGMVVVMAATAMGLSCYLGAIAFVLQEGYGLDETQFSLVFALGAGCMLLVTLLTTRWQRHAQPGVILRYAVPAVGGLLLAGSALQAAGFGGLWAVLVALWPVQLLVSVLFANAAGLALGRPPAAAGTATALMGACEQFAGLGAGPLLHLGGWLSVGLHTGAAGLFVAMAIAVAVAFAAVLRVRPWRVVLGAQTPEAELVGVHMDRTGTVAAEFLPSHQNLEPAGARPVSIMALIHFPIDISKADAVGSGIDWAPVHAAWKRAGAKHFHQISRDGEFIDLDEFPSEEAYAQFKAEAGPIIDSFEGQLGIRSTEVLWQVADRRDA